MSWTVLISSSERFRELREATLPKTEEMLHTSTGIRTNRMQATTRFASGVSSTLPARRRLIPNAAMAMKQ